jgi:hypothetical protein
VQRATMLIDEKLQSYDHLHATEGQTRTGLADTLPPPGRMRSAAPAVPAGRTGTILAPEADRQHLTC